MSKASDAIRTLTGDSITHNHKGADIQWCILQAGAMVAAAIMDQTERYVAAAKENTERIIVHQSRHDHPDGCEVDVKLPDGSVVRGRLGTYKP